MFDSTFLWMKLPGNWTMEKSTQEIEVQSRQHTHRFWTKSSDAVAPGKKYKPRTETSPHRYQVRQIDKELGKQG